MRPRFFVSSWHFPVNFLILPTVGTVQNTPTSGVLLENLVISIENIYLWHWAGSVISAIPKQTLWLWFCRLIVSLHCLWQRIIPTQNSNFSQKKFYSTLNSSAFIPKFISASDPFHILLALFPICGSTVTAKSTATGSFYSKSPMSCFCICSFPPEFFSSHD